VIAVRPVGVLPLSARRPGSSIGRSTHFRRGQVQARHPRITATVPHERIQTIGQARFLIVTGPDDLRARFARHSADDLVAELASLRPRPGEVVGYATRMALRELARRVEFPGRPARAPRSADRSDPTAIGYCAGHGTLDQATGHTDVRTAG
jgi:hypothetical protein